MRLTEHQLAVLTRLYEPNGDVDRRDNRTLETLLRRGYVYRSTHGRWRANAAGAALVKEARRA